jgi:hypothetical protein
MTSRKWEVGSQVTVTFRRKAALGANPEEFPPVQYLGVITAYSKGDYTVRLEGCELPFIVRGEQVDSILSLFAGIK